MCALACVCVCVFGRQLSRHLFQAEMHAASCASDLDCSGAARSPSVTMQKSARCGSIPKRDSVPGRRRQSWPAASMRHVARSGGL